MKLITVRFVPQVWVNDYAYNVDPEGEDTWEVPIQDIVDIEPDDYESDDLRHADNAPQWVKDWSGPFYVTWNENEVEKWLETTGGAEAEVPTT